MMVHEANRYLKKEITVEQLNKIHSLYVVLDLDKKEFCRIVDKVGIENLISGLFWMKNSFKGASCEADVVTGSEAKADVVAGCEPEADVVAGSEPEACDDCTVVIGGICWKCTDYRSVDYWNKIKNDVVMEVNRKDFLSYALEQIDCYDSYVKYQENPEEYPNNLGYEDERVYIYVEYTNGDVFEFDNWWDGIDTSDGKLSKLRKTTVKRAYMTEVWGTTVYNWDVELVSGGDEEWYAGWYPEGTQ